MQIQPGFKKTVHNFYKYRPTKVTTFIKAVCASASRPSLRLPLITTVFAFSGFIQRERGIWKYWRVGPETKPADSCAPCASNSLTAAGRTMAARFQGPERPLSVTHTHSCAHTLFLSLSLPDPLGYGEVERPLNLLVCTSILSVDKPQPPITDSQGYRHLQPAVISYLCVNRSDSSTLDKAATFLQTYRPVRRGSVRPL